jgi:copper chaperone CopZ
MKKEIYVHDIPGRLRVRTGAIKNDNRAAAAVRDLIKATPGVFSVETNPITGSITVRYDARRLSSKAILETLRREGFIGETAKASGGESVRPVLTGQAVSKVGRIVLGWALDRAISVAVASLF